MLFFTENFLVASYESYKDYELSSLQGSDSSFYDSDLEFLLKNIYDNFFTAPRKNVVENNIPKIIHFIWLDGEVPPSYNFCINSWKKHHPEWKIILWDKNKIKSLEFLNDDLFNNSTNNEFKKELATLLILDKLGGICVGIDFFCVRSVDFYTDRASLLIAKSLNNKISSDIIGASVNNEIIRSMIYKYSLYKNKYESTHVNFFTKTMFSLLKADAGSNDVFVLPQSYLYSFPFNEADDFWSHKKSLVDVVNQHVYPETLALRLWPNVVAHMDDTVNKSINLLHSTLNFAGQEFSDADSVRISDGATPLHLIAQRGSALQLKSLILAGAKVNALDNMQKTPLVYAIEANNVANVKTLLSFGGRIVNSAHGRLTKNKKIVSLIKRLANASTPEPMLIEACRLNQSKTIELLLEHGYKTNVVDKYNRTPIFYAMINNNLDMANLLILNGASLVDSVTDCYGKKAIDYASNELLANLNIDKFKHKIIVVTCSYNNREYCQKNLMSLFKQTYDNWECYYIDDNSKDGTYEFAYEMAKKFGMLDKMHFIKNNKNVGAMENQYRAIHRCEDRDVIVIYDGDDYFFDNSVLSFINDTYCNEQTWITYGSYVTIGHHPSYCMEPSTSNREARNFFRKHPWVFSHLRTFYAGLFKKIKVDDLKYKGEFIKIFSDFATMLPMLEMAKRDRFKFLKKTLYIYNSINPACDFKKDVIPLEIIDHIQNLEPYDPLESLFT